MKDRRRVDELSLDELERILMIRKREIRHTRLSRNSQVQMNVIVSESVERHPIPKDTTTPLELSVPIKSATKHIAVGLQMPQFEDDPSLSSGKSLHVSRRSIFNRLLLGVEISVICAFLGLIGMLFSALESVTRTTARIQSEYQATITAMTLPPTPTSIIFLNPVVLPSGHKFNEDNTVSYNFDEVPAEYREKYRQAILRAPPPFYTPVPQAPLNIRIPSIGVDSVVVSGDSWEDLKRGVGHHLGTANPGQLGNMILTAHNDVYGEIFRDLDRLRKGDQIAIRSQSREYTYTVQGTEIVEPAEVRVLDNSRRNVAQVTLISCYPYRVDNKRIVVYGIIQTDS